MMPNKQSQDTEKNKKDQTKNLALEAERPRETE